MQPDPRPTVALRRSRTTIAPVLGHRAATRRTSAPVFAGCHALAVLLALAASVLPADGLNPLSANVTQQWTLVTLDSYVTRRSGAWALPLKGRGVAFVGGVPSASSGSTSEDQCSGTRPPGSALATTLQQSSAGALSVLG